MTVEEDFQKAAKTKSVHFVSMQVTEDGGNEPHAEPTAHEKSPEKQGFASDREKPRRLPMEDNGLTPRKPQSVSCKGFTAVLIFEIRHGIRHQNASRHRCEASKVH